MPFQAKGFARVRGAGMQASLRKNEKYSFHYVCPRPSKINVIHNFINFAYTGEIFKYDVLNENNKKKSKSKKLFSIRETSDDLSIIYWDSHVRYFATI